MTTQEIASWIFQDAGKAFGSVFEAMAESRPEIEIEPLAAPPVFTGATFGWAQSLPPLAGETFLAASEEDVIASGHQALAAAGVEDASEEEKKSTFLESIKQVFLALARAMTARTGREIAPATGRQSVNLPEQGAWGAIRITFTGQVVTYYLALPPALLDALKVEPNSAEGTPESAMTSVPAPLANASPAPTPQTFDLLLDVELPVSVSFGHAHVPLKDVLKLTTGSIVELSRAIVEPVDVVVNNCVIAKGEVVVVEGNFGVRIQHVVSRSERLRTLQ